MNHSKITLSLVLSVVAVLAVFVGGLKILEADGGSNMFGYSWSSNIGWMKMNDCDNPANSTTCNPATSYGVSILPTAPGTMSGYAWSSNIGWISFNDPSCPTGSVPSCKPGAAADWAHPNTDGSVNIKGWARACSVYATGCSGTLKSDAYLGTWDGYIALDSVTAGGTAGAWGLRINADNTIKGYAWGSQVIGWIQGITSAIYKGGPTVALVANPASITSGQNSTLTVTATNIDGANACSFAGLASGLTMKQGTDGSWTGTTVVTPPITTTYTVNCTKGSQTATAQATVTVTYFISPGGGGGGGGNGSNGGYCANTYPQFSWNTNGTDCYITSSTSSIKDHVTGNVTDMPTVYGSTLTQINGLPYYTESNIPLPSAGTSSTYTLQCSDATPPVKLTTTASQCQADFGIEADPVGAVTNNVVTLVPSVDGTKMIATYTIKIDPVGGFNDPVTLDIQQWPSNIPGSRAAIFVPVTLTPSNGVYPTSQMTVSIALGDLKTSDTYAITIRGTDATNTVLNHHVGVVVGSIVKSSPIYKEF